MRTIFTPLSPENPTFLPPTMRFLWRTGLEIPWDMSPTLYSLVAHSSRKAVGQVGRTRIYRKTEGSRSVRRRIVGARVHAKALLVTSEEECRHQYESLQGTKLVSGTVVDVEISKTAQRANVFITTDFNLEPSFVKRKRQNVRSVYAGEASSYTQCC
jgi:hypothetical protein